MSHVKQKWIEREQERAEDAMNDVPDWAMRAAETIYKTPFSIVTVKHIDEMARIIAQHAPLDEAVKAIERYGVHSRSCDMEHRLTRARHCDCGFDAALAKLKGA